MIKLDAETGTVSWDEYELSIRLTHDEFKSRYPHLSPAQTRYDPDGFRWVRYIFPSQKIGDQTWRLSVSYVNHWIGGIGIECADLDNYEDIEEAAWWKAHLTWLASARTLILSQFGQPQKTSRGYLMGGEEDLDSEAQKLLVSWEYIFEWGHGGLFYDTLDMASSISIHYDRSQQIRDWDNFIADCDLRIENERIRTGKTPQKLIGAREVLDIIHPHIDYQTYRPFVGRDGVTFKLPNNVRVSAEMYQDVEIRQRKCRLLRTDFPYAVYVTDEAELVEALRLLLETEKP